jgi:hypothetical protein
MVTHRVYVNESLYDSGFQIIVAFPHTDLLAITVLARVV